MKIYTERMNPALSLYRFWMDVLEATCSTELNRENRHDVRGMSVNLGPVDRWGIWVCGWDDFERPVIALGKFGSYGGMTPFFMLAADGRFRFAAPMHGAHRRTAIALNTFLGWTYTHSRYQWLVSLERPKRGYYWGSFDVKNWRKPLHYVSEDVIGCRLWGQQQRWMVLKRVGSEWQLAPARNQRPPFKDPYVNRLRYERESKDARDEWQWYDGIRARRYQRVENDERARVGLPKRRRRPTLHVGKQALTGQDAELQLVALLDVSTPARTTPLQPRPKEAQHGSNDMATTNQF